MWWRIYYEDGSVFTSQDGEAGDAPRLGVQIVAQEHPAAGWEVVQGGDYFYYEPERRAWWTGDFCTAMDHLIRARRQCLLFGRMMPDRDFAQLMERVNRELGPRAGRTDLENRCVPP